MAKATGYLVRHWNAYPDEALSYIPCATRAEVEDQLIDYGYMENPGVHVYKLTKGETASRTIADLIVDPDPYPDYVVERGPRGGVQWNIA